MAHYTNSSKSIIKLQALIRGYLVRKKFSQLKWDYNEIVKCFEGNCVKVRWKNDSKLCSPIVDRECSVTRQGVNVLTDDVRQKSSCEKIDLSLGNELKDTTCANDIVSSVNCSSKTMPNVESTNKLSTSTPTESPINNWPSKDYLTSNLDQGLNEGLQSTCNSTGKTTNTVPLESSSTKTINHQTTAQENADQVKTDEKRRTDIVNIENCNGPNKDQILYPSDKMSLVKLREDLTMELLWIEQAIESRINYLAMKENMDKQLNN
ncbi:IQ domain-containing C [Paramuricea clavata]|uniref:IQ domain-containing C n=1 Tax=Paramuricea clavata TaxID=317549 RepID=A0A7D9I7Q2_PARCT|nr:IQ domain-containing C [Paramuricea clavata]